jgi:hemolysin III
VSVSRSGTPGWWNKARPFTVVELVFDGVVHGVGLATAIAAGTVLIVFAALGTAAE